MLNLLLVEPLASGHHMQYVRHMVRAGNRLGIHIQLLTSHESANHKSYQSIQEEFAGQFETSFLPSDALTSRLLKGNNSFAKQLGYYLAFQSFFRQLSPSKRPDIVFLPYLDYIDKIVFVLGSPFGKTPWSGLPMQNKFHYTKMEARRPAGRSDKLKQKIFLQLLGNRTLKSMFTIDELLYEYTRQYYPALAKKLVYVHDPVDIASSKSQAMARQKFGLPEAGKVLLVYGMLSLRKGLESLLIAMQQPDFPREICLFLAGTQQNDTTALLNSPAAQQLRQEKRLFEINQYLTQDDEGDAFRASDIVWVGYKEWYGMSGVMVQAGKMGLPIIACRAGLMGWMTRKYQIGLDIDAGSPSEIVAAVTCLSKEPDLAALYSNNGVRLAADFTSDAFADTICTTLAANISS